MGTVARICVNDGINDRNSGTAIVFGTRTEGIAGAGAMEVNRFRMSTLTSPAIDWTINSL